MNQRVKNIIIGIVTFTIYLILINSPTLFLNILHINYSNWSNNSKLLFNVFYEFFVLVIVIICLKDTFIPNVKEYFKHFTEYLKKYIKYWFIALGLMMIANAFIIFITSEIAKNQQSVISLIEMNPFYSFILAGILAPILEELIFRLAIYKIVGQHKYFFIVISGLIFGSMHIIGTSPSLIDWIFLIPYSIPGCVFAYTLVKSDNICVPISLHAIHNIFSLIIQIISI